YSGHTMMSFTSAGLTCAHHTHIALYGGGAVDVIACAVVLTAAAAEPVLRIAADHHYATDVTLGAVLGFASGYALPMALHYGRGAAPTAATVAQGIVPWAGRSDWGVRFVRAF